VASLGTNKGPNNIAKTFKEGYPKDLSIHDDAKDPNDNNNKIPKG
jgi:hypothetical protein